MMIKNLTIAFLFFCTTAQASPEQYTTAMIRHELLQTKYKQVYVDLTDINRREAVQSWFRLYLQNPEYKKVYVRMISRLNPWIQSDEYKNLLFYYHMTGQIENAVHTLGLYLTSTQALLENYALDPLNERYASNVAMFSQFLNKSGFLETSSIEKCYRGLIQNNKRVFDIKNASSLLALSRKCLNTDYSESLSRGLEYLSKESSYKGAPHPISYQGFIDGNKVDLWNRVSLTEDAITSLGQQLELIHTSVNDKIAKKYAEMTVEDYKNAMDNESAAVSDLFTRKEGFLQRDSHLSLIPISLSQPSIFQKVLETIDAAKETVFIDIFWMGGSIGVQLAKTLMKKTIENPEFQVFIITDTENRFNYGIQTDIVYKYMRAYSEKFPQKYFYILPANINLKRTALPEFVDLLFTNSTVNFAKSNENLDPIFAGNRFNLVGKSDHSKVVIVDGKNANLGTAFVGSKNWTDASGGIATDEVAQIHGPAVAAIQNHFYYDILEAFKMEDRSTTYLTDQIQFKLSGQKVDNKFKGIQLLLAPIDILDRWNNVNLYQKQIPYVEKGTDTIATAQNNIYGTETSAIDQNIHLILQAREQLIIDDQFLYDPFIARAIKTAIVEHKVRVYIMLEPLTSLGNDNKVMAHVPNNLFLPELVRLGAQVKWKIVPQGIAKTILSTQAKHGHYLAPEFHLKSLTIDGVRENEFELCQSDNPSLKHHKTIGALITGSANKDVMTMTGGFREYQILAYSDDAVVRHDCIFWSRWNNSAETESTDGLDFELPPEAKDLGLDQEGFINVLRMVFFSTYNFTKDFF
jgi:phosphatidylserine/phosphatidylglycerophosphate/cardiolipin synthase-like enzyme